MKFEKKLKLAALMIGMSLCSGSIAAVQEQKPTDVKATVETTAVKKDNTESKTNHQDKVVAKNSTQKETQTDHKTNQEALTKNHIPYHWLSISESMWNKDRQHLVLSPYSLVAVLESAQKVSSGKAQLELIRAMQKLAPTLPRRSKVFSSYNQIFVSNKLKKANPIKGIIEVKDLADQKVVDQINQQVSDVTNKKIEKLFDKPLTDTVLAFVNAMYFAAQWQQTFDKQATFDAPFHFAKDKSSLVSMMSKMGTKAGYKELEDIHAINLAFADSRYRYIALTGKKFLSAADLLAQLKAHDFADLIGTGFKETKMDIQLPKHEIRSNTDWLTFLKKTPLAILTESSAINFANISPEPLPVTKVFQKAYLKINEEGAEAAAATAMLASKSLNQNPAFILNQPFIELIVDQENPATPLIISVVEKIK